MVTLHQGIELFTVYIYVFHLKMLAVYFLSFVYASLINLDYLWAYNPFIVVHQTQSTEQSVEHSCIHVS